MSFNNQDNKPITAPALYGFVVTPSDTTDLSEKVRAVNINGAGVLSYHDWTGATRTTGELPAGTYALLAQRIRATGTTATAITGWV